MNTYIKIFIIVLISMIVYFIFNKFNTNTILYSKKLVIPKSIAEEYLIKWKHYYKIKLVNDQLRILKFTGFENYNIIDNGSKLIQDLENIDNIGIEILEEKYHLVEYFDGVSENKVEKIEKFENGKLKASMERLSKDTKKSMEDMRKGFDKLLTDMRKEIRSEVKQDITKSQGSMDAINEASKNAMSNFESDIRKQTELMRQGYEDTMGELSETIMDDVNMVKDDMTSSINEIYTATDDLEDSMELEDNRRRRRRRRRRRNNLNLFRRLKRSFDNFGKWCKSRFRNMFGKLDKSFKNSFKKMGSAFTLIGAISDKIITMSSIAQLGFRIAKKQFDLFTKAVQFLIELGQMIYLFLDKINLCYYGFEPLVKLFVDDFEEISVKITNIMSNITSCLPIYLNADLTLNISNLNLDKLVMMYEKCITSNLVDIRDVFSRLESYHEAIKKVSQDPRIRALERKSKFGQTKKYCNKNLNNKISKDFDRYSSQCNQCFNFNGLLAQSNDIFLQIGNLIEESVDVTELFSKLTKKLNSLFTDIHKKKLKKEKLKSKEGTLSDIGNTIVFGLSGYEQDICNKVSEYSGRNPADRQYLSQICSDTSETILSIENDMKIMCQKRVANKKKECAVPDFTFVPTDISDFNKADEEIDRYRNSSDGKQKKIRKNWGEAKMLRAQIHSNLQKLTNLGIMLDNYIEGIEGNPVEKRPRLTIELLIEYETSGFYDQVNEIADEFLKEFELNFEVSAFPGAKSLTNAIANTDIDKLNSPAQDMIDDILSKESVASIVDFGNFENNSISLLSKQVSADFDPDGEGLNEDDDFETTDDLYDFTSSDDEDKDDEIDLDEYSDGDSDGETSNNRRRRRRRRRRRGLF